MAPTTLIPDWMPNTRNPAKNVAVSSAACEVNPAKPIETLYMWAALPFAVGAVICFIVHRLNEARLAARPELRDAQ